MAVALPMADERAGVREDVWIPTACDMCYNGCTVKVHRVDGVAVKVEGIPEAGPNHGMTCAKGLSALMNVYSPNRIQHPMVRTNPEKGLDVDPGWKEISWDEALDLMARKLKKAMDKDPRGILVHTFDRYTYAVAKGFATALGAGYEVHAPVHAVTSVYIDMASRQEHRHVSAPGPTVAMACRVVLIVGFDLHQNASGATYKQLGSEKQRRSLNRRQRENLTERRIHGPNYRNLCRFGASTQ